MARAVVAALVAGLVLVLGGVALAMSDAEPRLAGTNAVFDSGDVVALDAGGELCERREVVAQGTAAVRLFVSPPAGRRPALAVRIRDGGHTVASGSVGPGGAAPTVDVPVGSVPRTLGDAQVCVRNRGPGPLPFRGYGTGTEATGLLLGGEPTVWTIRVSYLRAGDESWFALVPAIAQRMGVARGEAFGGWLFFGWVAVLLALGGVLVRAVLRELPR